MCHVLWLHSFSSHTLKAGAHSLILDVSCSTDSEGEATPSLSLPLADTNQEAGEDNDVSILTHTHSKSVFTAHLSAANSKPQCLSPVTLNRTQL